MNERINRLIDMVSDFLAAYPGLLPLLGILLIILNFLVQVLLGESWLKETNLLLHLGLISAIVGFMLIKPLG